MKPRTHSIKEAPTEPTEPKMVEGVENTPVPITRPTLAVNIESKIRACRLPTHMSKVHVKTPKWRPSPPATSGAGLTMVATKQGLNGTTYLRRRIGLLLGGLMLVNIVVGYVGIRRLRQGSLAFRDQSLGPTEEPE
ncbi:hypothetical protein EIP86_008503 [Pleurotus ostreatoroseus]|nr:hypothetical protein EIP86_008503 [Pleurotus ostreatoroseus]